MSYNKFNTTQRIQCLDTIELCVSNIGTETLVLIENLFKDKMCWDSYFRINRRKITQKQPLHIHMYIYIYYITQAIHDFTYRTS